MIKELLLVGFGGFAGSISRYLVGLYALRVSASNFPYGTLSVNLLGSLLIGLFAGFFAKSLGQSSQLVLMTGFCGGFTTFSTFSLEGVRLLRSALYGQYIGYIVASILGGLVLCFLGLWIAQKLVSH